MIIKQNNNDGNDCHHIQIDNIYFDECVFSMMMMMMMMINVFFSGVFPTTM